MHRQLCILRPAACWCMSRHACCLLVNKVPAYWVRMCWWVTCVFPAVQGREDLRLDQRLMQLLQLSNDLLGHRSGQHMRPLTVVPLGPRMGLISWVEGTMPLYGVVKAWQRRQLLGAGERCHHLPGSARLSA